MVKLTKSIYLMAAVPLIVGLLTIGALVAKGPAVTEVPAGTSLHVRLEQPLATNTNSTGDAFEATILEPVTVADKTVIPAGSHATGRVLYAHESGRFKGRGVMTVALHTVEVNGKSYEIQTSTITRSTGNHKTRNWAWIGGGGATGALFGGIAGGGKGALIGGPIGAGAGTLVAGLTGKKNVHLPAESSMTFRLAQPVNIQQS